MRMPGDDDGHLPRPGDDGYSGNLEDSGHHRKNLFFDSPEEILSPHQKESLDDDSSHLSSAVAASAAANFPNFHPISPEKPRSGRRFCVDEAELLLHEENDEINKHGLETINSLPLFNNNTNRNYSRRDSNSSIESDDSGYSFGTESVEGSPPSKPAATATSTPRKPRLPPLYTSAPKIFVSKTAQPPPSSKTKTKKKSLMKKKGDKKSISKLSDHSTSAAPTATVDDSTSSSSSRDEEDNMLCSGSNHESRSKQVPPAASNTTNKTRNKSLPFPKKPAAIGYDSPAYTKPSPGIKGCLRKDGKPSGQRSCRKMVRFGRLVITEFPIILGKKNLQLILLLFHERGGQNAVVAYSTGWVKFLLTITFPVFVVLCFTHNFRRQPSRDFRYVPFMYCCKSV
jgi:hypothetical protein